MKKQHDAGYTEGVVSILTNLSLFAVKYWAGIVSGSVSMIADAWHTLSDSLSSIIVIVGIKLSSQKPDRKHPFGYGRWEQISSIFIGVLLAIIAFSFVRESIQRFDAHESAHFGTIAIVVTVISIAGKEVLARYAFHIARKTGYTSIKADAWHHRSDALSSIVILVGISLKNYFWWIDSAMGIIVSMMLFYAVFDIMKTAINNLLGEELPSDLSSRLTDMVQSFSNEALHPHHFHLHNYGKHQELTFHIKVHQDHSVKYAHELATRIERYIEQKLSLEVTIHVEPYETDTEYPTCKLRSNNKPSQ